MYNKFVDSKLLCLLIFVGSDSRGFDKNATKVLRNRVIYQFCSRKCKEIIKSCCILQFVDCLIHKICTKYSQLLKRNFTITEKCKIQLHFLISKPCDVIVSMFASSIVDRGLESLFGQTIYHNIGTSLLHTRLRSNDNEWVILKRESISEWSHKCI